MSDVLDRVQELLGEAVIDTHDALGDDTVQVYAVNILEVMRTLRDDEQLRFNMLVDLTAVDYLGDAPRFEVVYHLASVETEPQGNEPGRVRHRLRVKAPVPEDPCEIDSVVELWPAANWMEREVWDMYGVKFMGHPDLRRLLLYEEFKGHPLRKDYPKERRQPLVGRDN
jgi:NADH-quinone oxidoreductase subunit C